MSLLAYDVQGVFVCATPAPQGQTTNAQVIFTLPPTVQLGKRIKNCTKEPSAYDSVIAHSADTVENNFQR